MSNSRHNEKPLDLCSQFEFLKGMNHLQLSQAWHCYQRTWKWPTQLVVLQMPVHNKKKTVNKLYFYPNRKFSHLYRKAQQSAKANDTYKVCKFLSAVKLGNVPERLLLLSNLQQEKNTQHYFVSQESKIFEESKSNIRQRTYKVVRSRETIVEAGMAPVRLYLDKSLPIQPCHKT